MGSGLTSSFCRRMSYAPSLFPALDSVCGAASFPGVHMGRKSGFQAWLWSCAISTASYLVPSRLSPDGPDYLKNPAVE